MHFLCKAGEVLCCWFFFFSFWSQLCLNRLIFIPHHVEGCEVSFLYVVENSPVHMEAQSVAIQRRLGGMAGRGVVYLVPSPRGKQATQLNDISKVMSSGGTIKSFSGYNSHNGKIRSHVPFQSGEHKKEKKRPCCVHSRCHQSTGRVQLWPRENW